MRRGHRAAHPGVVLASGALAAGMFCYGWSIRAGRPSVQPVAPPAPPPGAAWEVAIRTPDGVATVSYFDAGPAGDEGTGGREPAGDNAGGDQARGDIAGGDEAVGNVAVGGREPAGDDPRGNPAVDDPAVDDPARGNPAVGGATGPFLWASLPAGLDAAEPGLILELENEPPRVLGSIAPGLPAVPVPGGLAPGGRDAGGGRLRPSGGGRLVLVDLARELRLGWADLPGGPR